MKKKDIIRLQRQNKTKINPYCGVKTDYWTHEVRHIKVEIRYSLKSVIIHTLRLQLGLIKKLYMQGKIRM